jgi:hypothetical protein
MPCPSCGSILEPTAGADCPQCGTPAASAPTPDLRPTGVIKFLAGFGLFLGLVFLIPGAALLIQLPRESEPIFNLVFAIPLLVLALIHVTTALGMLRLRPWARWSQLAIAALGLLLFPFGTVPSALVLAYLFKPGARVLFTGRRAEELSPAEVGWLAQLRQIGRAHV